MLELIHLKGEMGLEISVHDHLAVPFWHGMGQKGWLELRSDVTAMDAGLLANEKETGSSSFKGF